MNIKINSIYFSPTKTTKTIVSALSEKLSKSINNSNSVNSIDITLPKARKNHLNFDKNELIILGIPVYAGRVPNVLLDYLNSIKGNNTPAIAIVLYGNRNYDDALIELKDIMESNRFIVIGGGAFIGQHSFSKILGGNRPDKSDMEIVDKFAKQVHSKLKNSTIYNKIQVKGNRPYRPYYLVKDENNNPLYDFRKIKPKTKDNCIDCKICVDVCPMGSIDPDNVSSVKGICIKCCACIKECPVEAKHFDSPDFIKHKEELELEFLERKEPELFI